MEEEDPRLRPWRGDPFLLCTSRRVADGDVDAGVTTKTVQAKTLSRDFFDFGFDVVLSIMSITDVKTYFIASYTSAVPQRGKYKGPTDDRTIGKKLKELRLVLGKSQTALAKELGINQSLISEYEKGSVRLHAPLLAGLARALHTSADEILGLKKVASNGVLVDRRFTRRLKQITQLPAAQQQAVLKLLDGVLESRPIKH